MEIRQIYYVLEIAKYKSFSKAAKSLYITQPAISQQISSLESELQTKLFHRDTHKVTLTEEGVRFCQYGTKILEAVDNLTEAFGQGKSDQKRLMNIGVYPFYRMTGLAKAVTFFFSSNSNVLGSLKVVENYRAYERLKSGKLDFAIIKAIPESIPSYIKYEVLLEEDLYAIMSNANGHAEEESIDLEELGKLPLLTGEKDSHLYDYMKNLYERHNLNFQVAFFNTKDVDVMLEMVASGTGILLATESVGMKIADKNIKAHRIVPAQKLCTVLVYKKEKKLKGSEIAFRSYIINYFQNLFLERDELIIERDRSTVESAEDGDGKP